MAKASPARTLELETDEAADKRRYWKGEAEAVQSALALVKAQFDAQRQEWRADRESWECERDAMLRRIMRLRESRTLFLGWAIGCTVVAVTAVMMR